MPIEDKAYLAVTCEGGLYRLQWIFEDEDGGFLLQSANDGTGEPPEDRESWEHWAASRAVRCLADGIDGTGAYWREEKPAKKALRVADAALNQKRDLPDWAKKALAAGWKPPKGWKA